MERLVRNRVLNESSYSTVPHFALIDLGLSYRGVNPASGWANDQCVLLVREAVSRLSSAFDEPVYYGVAQQSQLHKHRELLETLLRHGVSSQQTQGDASSWNIQTDASFSKLIDFSHFYGLPQGPLKAIRLSKEAHQLAQLCARNQVPPERQQEMQAVGVLGRCKPSHAWSWFLETDDSPLASWIAKVTEQPVHERIDLYY